MASAGVPGKAMTTKLRVSGAQQSLLLSHLFPGDGLEAVAVALCGRLEGATAHVLTIHQIVTIPYVECERGPDFVRWSTRKLVPLLEVAAAKRMGILRIHSHPSGFASFSRKDDATDRDIFNSVFGWIEGDLPHASAIMLPDGRWIARAVDDRLSFSPMEMVAVAGDRILVWCHNEQASEVPEFARRHAQLFGAGTTLLLRRLSAAVIGCSGTGSLVVEQLARLGVGRIVLVDPDCVEDKNLNRIVNARKEDALLHRSKVDVAAQAIMQMGLATEVSAMHMNLCRPDAVRAVAECDIAFGCMDGAEGRHLLNRIATYYLMPYIDVGVALEADGRGGIDEISGAVHYVQPGGSTLLDRGAYTMAEVESESLYRTNPEMYHSQRKEGYIRGVAEERPAVVSVNMLFSSMAVLELLARLHGYRYDGDRQHAIVYASIVHGYTIRKGEYGQQPRPLPERVGRGNTLPLLDMPSLSEAK